MRRGSTPSQSRSGKARNPRCARQCAWAWRCSNAKSFRLVLASEPGQRGHNGIRHGVVHRPRSFHEDVAHGRVFSFQRRSVGSRRRGHVGLEEAPRSPRSPVHKPRREHRHEAHNPGPREVRVDGFFRGVRRILSDLDEDEYAALRTFVHGVTEIPVPTENDIVAMEYRIKPADGTHSLFHVAMAPSEPRDLRVGPFPHALRLFHLLKVMRRLRARRHRRHAGDHGRDPHVDRVRGPQARQARRAVRDEERRHLHRLHLARQ